MQHSGYFRYFLHNRCLLGTRIYINLFEIMWEKSFAHRLVYDCSYTLVELFCHRLRVDIQSDVCHSPSCWIWSSGSQSPCTIISSSQRLCGLPLGRLPTGWITSYLRQVVVPDILLMWDHGMFLFLFAVCSAGWLHVYSPSNFLVPGLIYLVFLQFFCNASSLSMPLFLTVLTPLK